MSKGLVIGGVSVGAVISAILILSLRVYVGTEVAEVVIENPEPFIDAGETIIENTPKIIETVNIMCTIDELFINAIDSPMLHNVPDDAHEVLLLLKNGTEIDVCQAKILDDGLTAMQKNRINFKKIGCSIAYCLS